MSIFIGRNAGSLECECGDVSGNSSQPTAADIPDGDSSVETTDAITVALGRWFSRSGNSVTNNNTAKITGT